MTLLRVPGINLSMNCCLPCCQAVYPLKCSSFNLLFFTLLFQKEVHFALCIMTDFISWKTALETVLFERNGFLIMEKGIEA